MAATPESAGTEAVINLGNFIRLVGMMALFAAVWLTEDRVRFRRRIARWSAKAVLFTLPVVFYLYFWRIALFILDITAK